MIHTDGLQLTGNATISSAIKQNSINYTVNTSSTVWLKKRGDFVVWLVTLELLIRSAPNLAQTNDTSFLT